MKKLIFILFITACSSVFAASSVITNVAVNDSIVTITTADNRTNLSACVLAENAEKWAFSLTSTEGKSLYRAVLAANASGKAIEIVTADDCQALDGIERPQSIEINLL